MIPNGGIMQKGNVLLINNHNPKTTLYYNLKPLLNNSKVINIAVAFLKLTGLNLIFKNLQFSLKNGAKVNFIVGLDYGLTDPRALDKLYSLFKSYPNASLFLAQGHNNIFHTKLYLFSKRNNASVFAGSSNFTQGGFKTNEECSIRYNCLVSDSLYQDSIIYFNELLRSPNVFEANLINLEKYRPFFSNQKQIRKINIVRKPNLSGNNDLLEINFGKIKREFNKYISKEAHRKNLTKRLKQYEKAKIILDQIASAKSLNKNTFLNLYGDLIGAAGHNQLWHSGGLNRSVNKVIKQYDKFQKLIRYIKSNHHKSIDIVYDKIKTKQLKIKGIDVNILTEILATYEPNKFAILNNSPIKALPHFGCEIKSKASFHGKDYLKFCMLMQDFQKELGLKSLLGVDSFINYIYWKIKES
jgi:HKD family nuclease